MTIPDRAAIQRACDAAVRILYDEAIASDRALPYTPHNLTPPGITCPCELCNYRRARIASAVWWIGRALRALAGFDEETP